MNNKLAKNSLYNVIYRILNIIFPLISSIYVARVLMADNIGKVAAAQNIVQYFTILASMGIPTYGVKLIGQYKPKSDDSSKAFSELFIINLGLSVVCIIAYYSLIFISPYFDGKELLYSITGLSIVFNIINIDWFFQGIQEYGYIAARNLVVKICALCALFIFVKNPQDYIIYALIISGAMVGNYVFNILRVKRYVKLKIRGLEYSDHLKHILTLFAATIAAEVYVLADTTMLDVLCNSSVVGYYSMSMRIISIIRTLVVAISAVFLPQLSYYYFNGNYDAFNKLMNKGLHILTVISFPAAMGLAIVAHDAIFILFGSGFLEAVTTTRMLSISIITVAFSNYIGLQVLVTIGKEKITTISTICGALINITLNFLLIGLYQHNGAAFASVVTEATVTAIQLLLSKKYIKYNFGIKKVFVSTTVMGVIVLLISLLDIPAFIRLIAECTIGIITYIVMMLVLKDEFCIVLKQFVLKKVSSFRGN